MHRIHFIFRLAAEHMVVNDLGEKMPSIYTPTNPLSKVSVLAVLFKKFCINSGYIEPQPPLPQVRALILQTALCYRMNCFSDHIYEKMFCCKLFKMVKIIIFYGRGVPRLDDF